MFTYLKINTANPHQPLKAKFCAPFSQDQVWEYLGNEGLINDIHQFSRKARILFDRLEFFEDMNNMMVEGQSLITAKFRLPKGLFKNARNELMPFQKVLQEQSVIAKVPLLIFLRGFQK